MQTDCCVEVFFATGDLRDAAAVEKGFVGYAAQAEACLVFNTVRGDKCDKNSEEENRDFHIRWNKKWNIPKIGFTLYCNSKPCTKFIS